MEEVESTAEYWCEKCDANKSTTLIRVWGTVSSGKDARDKFMRLMFDERVQVQFHLCPECRKSLCQ